MTDLPPSKKPRLLGQYDMDFVRRSLKMTVFLWLAFTALAFLSGKSAVGWGFLFGGLFNVLDIGSLIVVVNLITQQRTERTRRGKLLFAFAIAFTLLKYPAFFAILFFGLRHQLLSFLNPFALFGFLVLFQGVVMLKIISTSLFSWVEK